MSRGEDGRIVRVRYGLARHKAGDEVDPGRRNTSTQPDANGVVELSPFELTGSPISCHHRENTGTGTTECLRGTTRCDGRSRRWPSGTSVSGAPPRRADMRVTGTPLATAAILEKSPAHTTHHLGKTHSPSGGEVSTPVPPTAAAMFGSSTSSTKLTL